MLQHQCCKVDGDVPDINYASFASYAKQGQILGTFQFAVLNFFGNFLEADYFSFPRYYTITCKYYFYTIAYHDFMSYPFLF